jgi:hypothetical protein
VFPSRQLTSRPPSSNRPLNSAFNPFAAAGEAERSDHFIKNLFIDPQLAVGCNPLYKLQKFRLPVLTYGSAHWNWRTRPRFGAAAMTSRL